MNELTKEFVEVTEQNKEYLEALQAIQNIVENTPEDEYEIEVLQTALNDIWDELKRVL